MMSVLRHLARNLSTVVLALALAIAVWIAATLQLDPFETQDFSDVLVNVINQPAETMLIESIVDRVDVVARARQSVVGNLGSSDFVATMDLAQVQPGTPSAVQIDVTIDNAEVRVLSWKPTEQTVYLEAMRTITLPVSIEAEGQVATGYEATRLQVRPSQVSVYGPESQLKDVASISGSVEVDEARANVVKEIRVQPVDDEGKLVSGVQWSPTEVEAQVTVRKRLGYKPDVEVVPDLRGAPAAGFRLGSVSVEPSTVTLAGVPSVLEELPGFVETWPISVTDATENLLERSPLTVPPSVVVVGVDFVTVTVDILPIQSSRALTATVEVRGVRPGWIATPSPNVVDVILEGPDTTLAEMTADDLRVVLDVFGLSPGDYRLEPDVAAPEGVVVVSIIPETIEIEIESVPTPTPTITITPTPTVTPTLTATP